jgi:hypothetical protein
MAWLAETDLPDALSAANALVAQAKASVASAGLRQLMAMEDIVVSLERGKIRFELAAHAVNCR